MYLRVTRKNLDPSFVNNEVERIAAKIVELSQPLAIYLFGSAAEGRATDQSDLDFLVVVGTVGELKTKQRLVARAFPLSEFPVDIIWIDKDEFIRKRQLGGVCLIAYEDGRLIHGADVAS